MSDYIIKGSSVTLRERRLADPTPILKRIGAMMTARAKMTFDEQGRENVRWPERKIPNVAGIVKDAEMGRKRIPDRRFQGRPAGMDTSFLRRSITNRMVGKNTVEIGTAVKYAQALQQGGPRKIRINAQTRANLLSLIKAAKKRILKGSTAPRDVGLSQVAWLLYRSEFTINPPPRPFIFFTKRDRTDAFEMISMYIRRPDAPPGTGVRV